MWTRTWTGAFVEAALWFLLAVVLLANVPAWAFNLVDQWLGSNPIGIFKPPTASFYGDLAAGLVSGVTLVIYVGLGLARIQWGQNKEREALRREAAR
ncbi:MAG TPA: hypothetical protein VK457_04695 [Chloroflexota bacterium]|jgi:hypothetical protein|nr:hypothetical protein [Chloroflexota bacterium]